MARKTRKSPPKDPNYAKELAKYDNPIPSREFILQIIREQNSPMSKEEIFAALGISEEEQQEAMRRRLRAMETTGSWCSPNANAMPYRKNWICLKAW